MQHLNSNIISFGLERTLSTGNWDVKRFRMHRKGMSQVIVLLFVYYHSIQLAYAILYNTKLENLARKISELFPWPKLLFLGLSLDKGNISWVRAYYCCSIYIHTFMPNIQLDCSSFFPVKKTNNFNSRWTISPRH